VTLGHGCVLTAVCLLALSACSSDDGGSTASSAPSPSASASAAQRAEHVDGETVTKAPRIVDGKVIVAVADASGSRELSLEGGVRSGPVSIAVNCEGKGTLTVELAPVGLSFPLSCVAGEVSSTFNQIALKKPRAQATVKVTAGSGVRWALSVGQ